MPPAIYSIPFDKPFLDTLVAGLMRRARRDPLALARMTVLLPTRRAARSLREAFLRASGGEAMLLPKMVPVGDLDPDELAFRSDEGDAAGTGFDLPPAVPPLRRQLLLTRLVSAFAGRTGESVPLGQAAQLAASLARFLDEAQTEGCDFAKLAALVPERLAKHWQEILTFLGIVTEHWPRMLEDLGCLDPAEWRNRMLAAQIAAWRQDPPAEPVIAAGLTGGIPAVAALMAAVALLPQGAVVLPGLDALADGALWEAVAKDPAHPQHLMCRFLESLELQPAAVKPWVGAFLPSARGRLVGEALAPAELSHRWRFVGELPRDAVKGLRRIDCPGPQEEAVTIALLLRESLEQPGATAALVTPDRDLARRVAAELKRWSIDIDDSAGIPLNKTPPGVFLRLVLDLAAQRLAPLPLLAALKHPLAAAGMAPGAFREIVRRLELEVLRGPRPEAGIDGLRKLLPEPARALHGLLARLDAALAPLLAALAAPKIALPALLAAHMSGPVVRPPYGRHPRLFIWGLLEARLQQADRIILGGLNENVWPPAPPSDPWLSRPMRQAFNLPPPERRVGVAALDFALALGACEVVMTRATRIEGTPTVPSRWLLRLDTVLRAGGLEGELTRDATPLGWQEAIDAPPGPARPIAPPEP